MPMIMNYDWSEEFSLDFPLLGCAGGDGSTPDPDSIEHYIKCGRGTAFRVQCMPAGSKFDPVNGKCPEGGKGSALMSYMRSTQFSDQPNLT